MGVAMTTEVPPLVIDLTLDEPTTTVMTTEVPPLVIDLTLDEPTTTVITQKTRHLLPSKHARTPLPTCQQPPVKKQRLDKRSTSNPKLAVSCIQRFLGPCEPKVVQSSPCRKPLTGDVTIEAQASSLRPSAIVKEVKAVTGLPSIDALRLEHDAAVRLAKLAAHSSLKVELRPPESAAHRQIAATLTTLQPQPKSRAAELHTKKACTAGLSPLLTQDSKPSRTAADISLPDCTRPQARPRPYLCARDRDAITRGIGAFTLQSLDNIQLPATYHVDFTPPEVRELIKHFTKSGQSPESFADFLLRRPDAPSLISKTLLRGRSPEDIENFCHDLKSKKVRWQNQITLTLQEAATPQQRAKQRRETRLSTLLLAREMEGNAGFGRMRQFENFQNQFRLCHEDNLSIIAEFTNCAGDISAISWVQEDKVICGTTAHSDSHNQQYNKPGNLLLCSTKTGTLQALADHRIPRPIVDKGENSTEAMRHSQDPWLYASVVSSDYDKHTGLAFTSSFDKTVKVWTVSEDSIDAIATWNHDGNVNFVAAAKDGSGRVATAADVPSEAIRIYEINQDAQGSCYYTISCTRNDAEGSCKWAYFPSTMQWGVAPGTQHLLAIGYSPRSFTVDDSDIPEDKLHTGEIALWDANEKRRVPVLTGSTANVFEVLWHPTLCRFIAATSPTGLFVESRTTKTQIHLFQVDDERIDGAYSEVQSLDCPASDINEVTIMPNSLRHAYITAACTDGRVYVWDTAQGDIPIHVLRHGYPVDDFTYDREGEDTGVKFTAWGTTTDRLYTGSSDGVVKVWNIRRSRRPFVRNLLEAPGPISCGAFSPDHAKLAIGDATGRVFLLSVDERDEFESHFVTLPGNRRVRRPKPFTPHAEPPPPPQNDPTFSNMSIGQYAQARYLSSHQLVLHPSRVIGAVRGPMYDETGLFRSDAHLHLDPKAPLLPEFERQQRFTRDASLGPRSRSLRRLKTPTMDGCRDMFTLRHRLNRQQDLDISSLPADVMEELTRAGARLVLDGDEGWDFEYEDMPSSMDDEAPSLAQRDDLP